MRAHTWAAAVLVGALAAGCATGDDGDSNPTPPSDPPRAGGDAAPAPRTNGPTYHADIAPLIAASCGGCHTSGGIAPFALGTYAEVAAVSPLMAASTTARRMPPWGAQETESCRPRHMFKHDLRLTDAQIAILTAWDQAGAPQGDPTEARTIEIAGFDELAGMTKSVDPDAPFTTQGWRDQFRCFVMDPGFTEDTWLNGVHVRPGNDLVAHHALVFLDQNAESIALADDDGAFDCFGSPGISDAPLVGVWAPGSMPTRWTTASCAKLCESRASTDRRTSLSATRPSTRCVSASSSRSTNPSESTFGNEQTGGSVESIEFVWSVCRRASQRGMSGRSSKKRAARDDQWASAAIDADSG